MPEPEPEAGDETDVTDLGEVMDTGYPLVNKHSKGDHCWVCWFTQQPGYTRPGKHTKSYGIDGP
jgi:hypothetical protein